MKKIIFVFLVLFLVSSVSFAENGASHTSDGTLAIGGSAPSDDLIIGLSPRVVGHYFTDGDSSVSAQWYAIAAVHPGGNLAYATAQDLNNVYVKWYVTGSDAVAAVEDVPQEKNPDAPTGDDPATDWTGKGWLLTTPTGPPEA